MSRLPIGLERNTRLGEESLFLISEVREHITAEARLLHFLEGLEEADKLELAEATADVDDAVLRLRIAKGHFEEVGRRFEQKAEIRARIRADFELEEKEVDEIAHGIAVDAHAAGVKHIRPELLNGCGCSATEKATV